MLLCIWLQAWIWTTWLKQDLLPLKWGGNLNRTHVVDPTVLKGMQQRNHAITSLVKTSKGNFSYTHATLLQVLQLIACPWSTCIQRIIISHGKWFCWTEYLAAVSSSHSYSLAFVNHSNFKCLCIKILWLCKPKDHPSHFDWCMHDAKNTFFPQDALNLSKRPFAHNSSLLAAIAACLFLIWHFIPALRENHITKDLPLMFTVSILSHHLRDADRRGIWCAPFGSTPAIPHKLYIGCVLGLPLCTLIVPLAAGKLRRTVTTGFHHQSKVLDVWSQQFWLPKIG